MKRKEEKKTRAEKLRDLRDGCFNFLYKKNDEGQTVIAGRTGSSWAKISAFFFVYYLCLTGFFAAMFAIAFSTMPEIKDGPKYTALIADKPVLLVYPPGGVGSYKENDIPGIAEKYERFLKAYKEQYEPCYGLNPCEPGQSYRPDNQEKQCYFNINSLGPCKPEANATFGYSDKKPCLYLRLTKIFDWKPKPKGSGKYIELDCAIEGDDDAMVSYYPPKNQAFPISFWPFRGESHFMTPIAAIQINNTKSVTVKCKAIAENIDLSSTWKLKKGATGKLEFDVGKAES